MPFTANIRFHFTLNDFLAPVIRNTWISYSFKDHPAVKDAIEAIGVPHPEVNVIIVNCNPVDFRYKLQSADQVEVYPVSAYTMWPEKVELVPKATLPFRFVLDVHLGKLARLLRMLGFDTVYDPDLSENEVAHISEIDRRILLTRGVGILKLKSISQGYWLRSQDPEEQLREVVAYYNLAPEFRVFTRCMVCNGAINLVEKEKVDALLPTKTKVYFQEFYQCSSCRRVYWKGSHYERMQEFIWSLSY